MATKRGKPPPKPVDIPNETLFTIRRITMALVSIGLFAAVTLVQPYDINLVRNSMIDVPFVNASISFVSFLVVGPLVLLAIWGYLQINLERVWRPPVPPDAPPWGVLGLYPHPVPALVGWLAQTALVQVLLFGFAFKATIFPLGIWPLVVAYVGSFMVALVAAYRRWPDPPQPWLRRGWKSRFWRRASLAVELVLLPAFLLLLGPQLGLDRVDMTHGKLEGEDLRNLSLRGAIFDRAEIRNAAFTGSDLQEASFFRANLKEANLTQVILTGANLEMANLEKANLEKANLRSALLKGARLSGAFLLGVDLQDALLDGANLREAYLLTATNLTRGQICSSSFDETTTFPDGSNGHTAQEVCSEGVQDDVFGLTPP